jgi:small-conductance mechanosensitive channel
MSYLALHILKESSFYLLALITGVICFRRLNLFYRIIFFQVCVAMVQYLLSYVVTRYQHAHGMEKNNHWVFNVYLPIEAALLGWAGIIYLRKKSHTVLIITGYLLFLIYLLYEISGKGIIKDFLNNSACLEGSFVVLTYLLVLYHQLARRHTDWKNSSYVWLCLGTILFFGGYSPFLGMLDRLSAQDQNFLFPIISALEAIRHTAIALSFILYAWQARRLAALSL